MEQSYYFWGQYIQEEQVNKTFEEESVARVRR